MCKIKWLVLLIIPHRHTTQLLFFLVIYTFILFFNKLNSYRKRKEVIKHCFSKQRKGSRVRRKCKICQIDEAASFYSHLDCELNGFTVCVERMFLKPQTILIKKLKSSQSIRIFSPTHSPSGLWFISAASLLLLLLSFF